MLSFSPNLANKTLKPIYLYGEKENIHPCGLMYNAQCTVYNVQGTVYNEQGIVYNVQGTV